jgi:hypothetical protein
VTDFAQFGSGKAGRPVVSKGERISIGEAEAPGFWPRPGTVLAVSRGAWGFTMSVTSIVEDDRGRFYRGEVLSTHGDVPCA